MASNGSLSAAQRRLIPALLTCRTVTAAAESARVAERTAFRWLADDANFQAELARAEGDVIGGGTCPWAWLNRRLTACA